MVDGARIESEDVAADGVDGRLRVPHEDERHLARLRREHPPFTRHDAINRDKLRLNDELKIADLFVEPMIVIDEPMTIILDADVILHREGDRRPRVALEFRTVDKRVGLCDRLGREEVVAEAPRVGERDLDLRLLLEMIVFYPGSLKHRVVAGPFEGHPRRDGDAATLADSEFGHRLASVVARSIPILDREQHAFEKLGACVRMEKLLTAGHTIRFDERLPLGNNSERLHPFTDDSANRRDVVAVAVAKDDTGPSRYAHSAMLFGSVGRNKRTDPIAEPFAWRLAGRPVF
mgnify:CR=1 FL=1